MGAATPTPPAVEAACQQPRLPGISPPAVTPGPRGGELLLGSDRLPPDLFEDEAPAPSSRDDPESSPGTESVPRSTRQGPGPAAFASTGRRPWPSPTNSCNHSFERSSPPTPAPPSPAFAAALACAHGIGGRLGTPLGSPYPAPGEDWVAGRSASASARAATAGATKRRPRRGGLRSSAPGSRFFPPVVSAGGASGGSSPAASVAVTAPVVFEMVQDAAEDEEDAAAEAAEAAAVAVAEDDLAERRGAGWHGLMLYRYSVGRPPQKMFLVATVRSV